MSDDPGCTGPRRGDAALVTIIVGILTYLQEHT